MVSIMAKDRGLTNLGLVKDPGFQPCEPGVYHTTVADMASGAVISLASRFDQVVMLDQPRSSWTHWKLLQSTYKIMVHLEAQNVPVVFRDNVNVQSLQRIESLVQTNKSFCIYPWINLVNWDDGGLRLCARSSTVVTPEYSVSAWQQSPVRADIKSKMLQGQRLPEHCSYCYRYEDLGIESYRQYETRDWLNTLGIDDLKDLPPRDTPRYYEIDWSSHCNLKCRGCTPWRSSAIELEFKKHNIQLPWPVNNRSVKDAGYPKVDVIDVDSLDRTCRVYVTGGEPVIMPETVEFMRRCIERERTDFELTMSTNGVQIPSRFREMSKHFTNLNLSFSLDGYDEVNDYWRSGAVWSKIVRNMHDMRSLGHTVTVNCVPGIYNVTNLHRLFEWLDREFPKAVVYLQINHNELQSAYNHPDAEKVIDSMLRCQKTQVYWSDGKSCRTAIDSLLQYYQAPHEINWENLRGFFDYNDRLDAVRGVRLADAIPELEACRTLLK